MASKSSPTDAAGGSAPSRRKLPERVAVGLVRRPHGVRGEMVVEPLSEVPGRLAPGAEVEAFDPRGGRLGTLRVTAYRPFKDAALLCFAEIADRDAAEPLRGATLEIDRSRVPPAPDGGFYYFELIGCRCSDRTAGELGEVVRVTEDGGGHLLWVQGERGLLPVPLVRHFLAEVDIAAGRIELDLPEGLIETCGSTS
jgi:16S rRNA processing protein RimM